MGGSILPILIDDVIADRVEHGKFWVIQWDIFSAAAQNLKVILLLPLSTIPAFAASVIGATAIIAMLTLRSLRLVAFAAMVLFPPATVQVATTSFDEAGRHCQHAYRDHCKTQASHSRAPQLWIFKLLRSPTLIEACHGRSDTATGSKCPCLYG